MKDKRGWLFDPISFVLDAGISGLENKSSTSGYSETTIGADEVAVAASSSGTAHALMNIDAVRTTFFLGCQDSVIDYNASTTDFNVWNDL
ncbi:hypothetical protein OROGR_013385 [Orobanche gracilis]